MFNHIKSFSKFFCTHFFKNLSQFDSIQLFISSKYAKIELRIFFKLTSNLLGNIRLRGYRENCEMQIRREQPFFYLLTHSCYLKTQQAFDIQSDGHYSRSFLRWNIQNSNLFNFNKHFENSVYIVRGKGYVRWVTVCVF